MCTSQEIFSSSRSVEPPVLPHDILFLILEPLRPQYERPKNSDGGVSRLQVPMALYNKKLVHYAALRLVCAAWDQVLAPITFREMVIFISETTNLEALERVVGYTRSLVMDRKTYLPDFFSLEAFVARLFRMCPDIRNLEFYNDKGVFTDNEWLASTAPHLVSNVTSLVITSGSTNIALYNALVGLGRSLQSLEIRGCKETPEGSLLLPDIPNLSRLSFLGGSPSINMMKELFLRITTTTIAGDKNTPLRSLRFEDVNSLSGSDIKELLSINGIGARLVSLHIRMSPTLEAQRLPMDVMGLCPSLIDFSFTSLFHVAAFQHFPSTLQTLEVLLALRAPGIPADLPTFPIMLLLYTDDLIQFLVSGRCPALHTLTVATDSKLTPKSELARLEAACARRGVDLRVSTLSSVYWATDVVWYM